MSTPDASETLLAPQGSYITPKQNDTPQCPAKTSISTIGTNRLQTCMSLLNKKRYLIRTPYFERVKKLQLRDFEYPTVKNEVSGGVARTSLGVEAKVGTF